jgi:hypothetical protein
MSIERILRGEYMHLPAVTRDAAIIAWGGFFFEVGREDDQEAMKVTPIGHRQDGRLRPIMINPVGGQPISALFII